MYSCSLGLVIVESEKSFRTEFRSGSLFVVILSSYLIKEDGTIVIGAKSIEDPRVPLDKKLVRGELQLGGWILTPDPNDKNKTKACYIACSDLKGNIPSSLFKTACRSNAISVHELRNYVEKMNKNKK